MGLPAFKLPVESTRFSVEDYLALEQESEFKSEFTNGFVWAMAGASPAHNALNYNFNQVTGAFVRQCGCQGYSSDQRVQTKNQGGYLYPDTVVACNPTFNTQPNPPSLTNPVFILEVTSASTGGRDHDDKFMLYRQIESLRQYLMLSSKMVHAELYTRDEHDRWVLTETRNLTAVLDLHSIGCQVLLSDVYAGVTLEPAELNE